MKKLLEDEENFYRTSKKQKLDDMDEQPNQKDDQPTPLQPEVKAAWDDDEEIEVDLTQTARLRKLRENEKESVISGVEYQKRLQKFYENKLFQSDFFKWGHASENQDILESDSQFNLSELLNTDCKFFTQ